MNSKDDTKNQIGIFSDQYEQDDAKNQIGIFSDQDDIQDGFQKQKSDQKDDLRQK